jgi:hypothetical protein
MLDFYVPSTTIKAISLWQPWASLMALGLKRHETRHWPTAYRGPIAIHAAKTLDLAGAPDGLSDWFRSLRDQCAAAGVAFHHKQNGEFAPIDVFAHGEEDDPDRLAATYKVGKRLASRTLDGVIHDARPQVLL